MLDRNQLQAQGIHTIDTTPPLESQKLIALLKEHAPHAFSDGKLDLKALARLLGEETECASYELNFLGKREANKLSSTPATKELKSEPDRSIDFDTTGNAIIIGDNLHALKTLRAAYHGKVKMIYIDPPYNTGSDGFIYRDHFGEDYKNILRELNLMEFNDDGEEMLSKRINYFKNIFGDKTHSGWLSFMYPRLRLAQDLLRDDGVIFISIDDNEQANLKILCDEIFGEHNFVACLPRITKKAGKSTASISKNHDYILIYEKQSSSLSQIKVNTTDYPLRDEFYDTRGGYKLNQTLDYDSLQYSTSMDYEAEINGVKFYAGGKEKWIERREGKTKKIDWVWRWSKEKLDFGVRNGFVAIKGNRIYTKTYLNVKISKSKPYTIETIQRGKNLTSLDFTANRYSNDYANKNIKLILEEKNLFNYSKPKELIQEFLEIATNDDDIVMDFFAGSGTTAHAVMELNAEDKNNGKQGNRKFILVQLDEAIDEKANKVAYDFCKSLGSENPTIADITIERVKRAGKKIKEEKIREANKDSAIDTGFKVFSLIDKRGLSSQEQDLLTLASSPLTPYQKAINLALHAGRTLDTRIQPVIEGKLYRDECNFYLIACDKEVQKHLAADKNKDIFLSGYEDIAIQDLLNLQASIQKTRLKVLF